MVTEAAQHIIAAGGKRFRPLLVVLGSSLGPRAATDDVVKAAVVVELTHVASLYHDDVMDEARMRRGSVSANSRWGNTVAILVGDLLFARASDIVADLGPGFRPAPGAYVLPARAGSDRRNRRPQRRRSARPLPPGRGRQDRVLDRDVGAVRFQDLRRDVYLQRVMADFGEQIGVVFQLSDDIIDITSDDTGKTPGTDLREGIPTLPTILARKSADPADARLLELLDSDLHDDDALHEVLDLLRHHRCIDDARTEVRRRAEAARALLEPLPAGPARDALDDLCTTVVTRTA